ncbi:tryptophan-rich sensory protein [Natronomonas salina]|uniref:TspO/MBR family protein n=1 Tax=Natronomonas salina TaxID=1710540 RepID=UPI0015B5DEFE|nr:TspO/MBR family protein [Natronomonas salina]QLD90295.1 tryptophan-rich sensory protein [Natronomonas salina]
MEYSQRPRSGSSLRDLVAAVVTVLAVNALGASPSVFIGSDTSWIDRPWLFPPTIVWTALFTLMGVALYLVGRRGLGRRDVKVALAAFAGQFTLNLAWTPVFFGLQRPGLGLLIIGALWVAIVGTIAAFDRVDRRAAALLVPYLAWVSFAALLNYAIYAGWS